VDDENLMQGDLQSGAFDRSATYPYSLSFNLSWVPRVSRWLPTTISDDCTASSGNFEWRSNRSLTP